MDEARGAGAASEVVTDAILGGRLVLRQPCQGHRAGTDAVLLAAAARIEPGDVLVDVGSGVGTVGLAVALREPSLRGILLDNDPVMSGLAEENCSLNGLDTRMRAVAADLFEPGIRQVVGLTAAGAAVVVTNPPFFDETEVRRSTDSAKARAHVLSSAEVGHGDWLRAAVSLLAPHGRFYAIHRPEAVPALLSACEGKLGGISLIPVYPRADASAIRVLIAGVKGSRAPMRIGAPLVLHDKDGRFTPEAEAIHRGEALVPS